MIRSRAVLILVVLASVASLYSLPRVVVENDESSLETSNSAGSPVAPGSISTADIPAHSGMQVPDSVLVTANALRTDLFSENNPEKRLIFADSLAELYRRAGAYDSAVVYLDMKVGMASTLENLLQAGDVSYEAMGFAMDQGRRSRWAERAREYYNRAMQLNDDLPDVQVKVGMTHVSGDNPMTGIMMIRQVAEAHPENTLALYQLGMLSVSTGQYDKAIERFQTLLDLEADNAEAIFYLGYSYLELGRKEEAREQFEKVVNLKVSAELRETATQYLKQINNI